MERMSVDGKLESLKFKFEVMQEEYERSRTPSKQAWLFKMTAKKAMNEWHEGA